MAGKKKSRLAERHERRFFPQSTANPIAIRVLGAIGALLLGAGAFGQFVSSAPEPFKGTPWLLAAGAALFGLAIWFGTSGDPVLRVGDGGVGMDKGTTRRIPWWAVKSVTYDAQKSALLVAGKDEADVDLTIAARVKSQPQAAAWILKEADARLGEAEDEIVDVSENARSEIPEAVEDPADVVKMDPLQVVGKKCAESGKTIAYEPDARVCPRCERVYHKNAVPKTCACGASLAALAKQK